MSFIVRYIAGATAGLIMGFALCELQDRVGAQRAQRAARWTRYGERVVRAQTLALGPQLQSVILGPDLHDQVRALMEFQLDELTADMDADARASAVHYATAGAVRALRRLQYAIDEDRAERARFKEMFRVDESADRPPHAEDHAGADDAAADAGAGAPA